MSGARPVGVLRVDGDGHVRVASSPVDLMHRSGVRSLPGVDEHLLGIGQDGDVHEVAFLEWWGSKPTNHVPLRHVNLRPLSSAPVSGGRPG